jgi:hypothetical protein
MRERGIGDSLPFFRRRKQKQERFSQLGLLDEDA